MFDIQGRAKWDAWSRIGGELLRSTTTSTTTGSAAGTTRQDVESGRDAIVSSSARRRYIELVRDKLGFDATLSSSSSTRNPGEPSSQSLNEATKLEASQRGMTNKKPEEEMTPDEILDSEEEGDHHPSSRFGRGTGNGGGGTGMVSVSTMQLADDQDEERDHNIEDHHGDSSGTAASARVPTWVFLTFYFFFSTKSKDGKNTLAGIMIDFKWLISPDRPLGLFSCLRFIAPNCTNRLHDLAAAGDAKGIEAMRPSQAACNAPDDYVRPRDLTSILFPLPSITCYENRWYRLTTLTPSSR